MLYTFRDALQFDYHFGDAIIHLLQQIHRHLDKTGSTVRFMLCDSSGAFNIIQPDLLCQKLQKTQAEPGVKGGWFCSGSGLGMAGDDDAKMDSS